MSNQATHGAAFWSFALATYERRSVREICLRLQDDHSLDVMLLLGCLWAGYRGLRLDPAQVAAMADAVAPWQTKVTVRLRKARLSAKKLAGPLTETGPLRSAILSAERAAERVTAELVADVLATAQPKKPPESAIVLAIFNLKLYFEQAGITTDSVDEDRHNLAKAAYARA